MVDDTRADANLRIQLLGAVDGNPTYAQAVWEIIGPELARLRTELAVTEEAVQDRGAEYRECRRRLDDMTRWAYDTNSECRRELGDWRAAARGWEERAERVTAERDALSAIIEDLRHMVQVWIDIRPTKPTVTNDAHTLVYAGQQILAALPRTQETENDEVVPSAQTESAY